jgi:hypothetical protein
MAHKQAPKTAPEPEVSPAPAPATTRAAVEWARDAGSWPQFLESSGDFPRPNPDYWKLAATLAFRRWTTDQQVTEAEFSAAVTEMLDQRHG